MAWFYLVIAGLFEVIWAIAMKYADGLSRFWPVMVVIIAGIISFILLALSLKNLPVGTAYAVWTGIGAVGTAIYGIFVFGESANLLRLICLLMIFCGIIGLKLFSGLPQH